MATTSKIVVATKAIAGLMGDHPDGVLMVEVLPTDDTDIAARFRTNDGHYKATIDRMTGRVTSAWVDPEQ